MLPPPELDYPAPTPWVQAHLLANFSMTDFAPGSRILDIGCGPGRNLGELIRHGFNAEGVDSDPAAVQACEGRGLRVQRAFAEALPFEDQSFQGEVFDQVLQYTDERRSLSEAYRVLKGGGSLRMTTQGCGYALHVLFMRRGMGRVYGARMLLNSLCFALMKKRLPGKWGDTVCYLPGQLADLCRQTGFEVEKPMEGRRFAGFSVFIYTVLHKRIAK